MHKGTLFIKLKSTLSLATAVSPIAYVLERTMHWALANETYVWFVLIAIAIDHILGSVLHALKQDFKLKKNIIGLITKMAMVVAVGMLFEGVNEIVQEDSFVKSYLIITLRLTVFMYPAGSAFWNSSILTKGKFPPIGWLKIQKRFSENLDIKQFKNED